MVVGFTITIQGAGDISKVGARQTRTASCKQLLLPSVNYHNQILPHEVE